MKVKIKYYFIFLALFLITFCDKNLNAQVTIILQQPPPNRLLIEDLWKLRIINSSKNSYLVYLTATVTEAVAGQILDGTSKNLTITPGLNILTSNEVGNVDVHYLNEDIKNIIKKTGSVPSGNYTICVNVVKADGTGQFLATTCLSQDVNNYTQPIIISPNDKDMLSAELPVFNWLPPTPIRVNQNLTYTLKVVEIIQKQSGLDAMRSNPEWFIHTNITVPIYQYNFSSRRFVPGTRYAWKVLCYVNGIYVNESVIQEFTFIQNVNEKEIKGKVKPRGDNFYDENSNYSDISADKFSLDGGITSPNIMSENYIKSQIENIHLSLSNEKSAGGNEMHLNKSQLEKKMPNFILSGSSRIFGQNSNRQGTDQLIPQKYAVWEFNPSISVYKIPLSVNLLLTTQQTDSKQNINNIGIGFDPNTLIQDLKSNIINRVLSDDKIKEYDNLKTFVEDPQNIKNLAQLKELEKLSPQGLDTLNEYIELKKKAKEIDEAKEKLKIIEQTKKDVEEIKNSSDPNETLDKLKKYGGISPLNSFLLGVRTFGIATTYPNYTNLTLSGVPVTGANLELNPGLLYFAITALKNNKAIQTAENNQPVFARKLIGTRLGVGKYDATHFYLTYLYAKDDANSVKIDSTITVTPSKDHLLGLEGKISALDNKLEFKGELTGSLYTRDITSPEIQNSAIPDFLKNTFGIKLSSSVDYAYLLNASLKLDKYGTRISAGMNMTGPGYVSLGAPNIRNDNMGFEVKLDQLLLNNQIAFSGFLRREKDNLIAWKQSTTVNTLSNVTLNLRFKDLPYLLFVISPNMQLNNQTADSLKVDNKTTLMTFSTGYGSNIFDVFTFTNLTYSQQSGKTHLNLGDYSSKNFIAFETISFRFPFSLSLSYGFTTTKVQSITSNINSYDISGTYTFFNKLQNTGGVDYSNETGNNRKIGIYYSVSIPVSVLGTFDLRVEKNIYKENVLTSNNYDEFIMKATFSSKW
jgi:hypothetical protein